MTGAKSKSVRAVAVENVRAYDCRECRIHFEAETEFGDAYEFDPDCPRCGDPTGASCFPCRGDARSNGYPFSTPVGSPLQSVILRKCLYPGNVHSGVVPLPAR